MGLHVIFNRRNSCNFANYFDLHVLRRNFITSVIDYLFGLVFGLKYNLPFLKSECTWKKIVKKISRLKGYFKGNELTKR